MFKLTFVFLLLCAFAFVSNAQKGPPNGDNNGKANGNGNGNGNLNNIQLSKAQIDAEGLVSPAEGRISRYCVRQFRRWCYPRYTTKLCYCLRYCNYRFNPLPSPANPTNLAAEAK